MWDRSNGAVLKSLQGHIGDVYYCGFFPSGEVSETKSISSAFLFFPPSTPPPRPPSLSLSLSLPLSLSLSLSPLPLSLLFPITTHDCTCCDSCRWCYQVVQSTGRRRLGIVVYRNSQLLFLLSLSLSPSPLCIFVSASMYVLLSIFCWQFPP